MAAEAAIFILKDLFLNISPDIVCTIIQELFCDPRKLFGVQGFGKKARIILFGEFLIKGERRRRE